MKKSYIFVVVSSIVFLSGCGVNSGSSIGTSTALNNQNTVQVVRGPVLGAIVKDSTGKIAKDLKDANGHYRFNSSINYPVTVTGGVIDINRDGKISIGDVKNDLNLTTTSGNVITMLTTYAANPTTKNLLDKVASDFNVTLSLLESKTPLDSKKVEAISNVIYKYAQDNNISTSTTSKIEQDIKSEYLKYTSNSSHNSLKTEKTLMDSLSLENKVSKLNQNEVSNEIIKLDNEYNKELNKYELENGDSEYVSNGSYSSHYEGQSCLKCHGAGGISSEVGEAGENQFTSGGTVFTKINAQDGDGQRYANGYTIRLVLENVGQLINYNQGRGTGNSNVSFSLGTVNGYTAEVVANGQVVNKSLTNSHNVARLDCNKCHTSTGANGAPGRIVSFNYYAPVSTVPAVSASTTTTSGTATTTSDNNSSIVKKSFSADVLPILNSKCKSCHGSFGNFSITNSSTPYVGVTPFVTTSNADFSRLLKKASGTISHGGGVVINSATTEYVTIRSWISEGAKNN